ncbi:MAG: carboxylesterase family protein [bacterium]
MNKNMTRAITAAALSVLIFISVASRVTFADTGDCAEIATAQGNVTGVADSKAGVCSYKGIPFAAPPVGKLRWATPKEPAPRDKTLVADKYGNVCVQAPFSLLGSSDSKGKYEGDEDCLYLNVWHPAGAPKGSLPVMVFIHGGSNLTGAGSWELYDGTRMASLGKVVLVTINYRLGPFGMMAHPALRDAAGIEGNYFSYDQLAALKWVKSNIANFAGDPENVTLFGESAGGMNIAAFLLSPIARGLFQKAIIESGPPIFLGAPLKPNETAALDAAAKLGCQEPASAADCLRKADSASVMKAFAQAMTPRGGVVEVYDLNPVMDDVVVFKNPYKMFAEGNYNKDVRLIIGTNRDEAGFYAMSKTLNNKNDFEKALVDDTGYAKSGLGLDLDLNALRTRYPFESYKNAKKAYIDIFTDMIYGCPAIVQVWQLAGNNTPVYQYLFSKSPDEKGLLGDIGVFHSAELPFVFGNFSSFGISFSSPKNIKLSKSVISLWTSFARDGVPKAEGFPEWPLHTKDNPAYLKIDLNPAIQSELKKDACSFFDAAYRKTYSD